MEPPVENKFHIDQKICGRFFGEIYLGGTTAVAKGKRRAVEEPVDKATLQKQRHMIKSLLLGPGNANIFLNSSFQYPVVKIGTEDQSFIDSVMKVSVEARLATLLMENKEFSEALTLLSSLVKDVRRLDDKLLLVDIDLLESKLHFSLRKPSKGKSCTHSSKNSCKCYLCAAGTARCHRSAEWTTSC
ncbi:uncharacterized protein DS421_5g141420 [Arachis hypogaea]|nr:uncharacterized protein DS421_5g141420 [Arachis hypogaea]